MSNNQSFRLLDFTFEDLTIEQDESSEEQVYECDSDSEFVPQEGKGKQSPKEQFTIKVFGLNEKGETLALYVEEFRPFFYVKVKESWKTSDMKQFLGHIQGKIGKYYEKSILTCKYVRKKKLYLFDKGKQHKFILFEFENLKTFNKVKNLWYDKETRKLTKGLVFNKTLVELYESNIPPLLRFFHIQNISPSGWIELPANKIEEPDIKTTHCTYEYFINFDDIVPLNDKETIVPYKICSFDIEASSSHGDFPVPKKDYKKLASNLVDYWKNNDEELESLKYSDEDSKDAYEEILKKLILSAFGFGESQYDIDLVYPKKAVTKEKINNDINLFIRHEITNQNLNKTNSIQDSFCKFQDDDDDDEKQNSGYNSKQKFRLKHNTNVIDVLNNKDFKREEKVTTILGVLDRYFPKLEGDKVTFIGSTFMRYGEKEPYLNHCIVLDSCECDDSVKNCEIESKKTEREVLLGWKDIILREDPDIIIGYNIFGFDYSFMFRRAVENKCEHEFLQLSRNKDEICNDKRNEQFNNKFTIEETSIVIASGQHDLEFIKMPGRLQIDLYNYFRRDYNLTSYKLDSVSSHFIGDNVKNLEYSSDKNETTIISKNLTGLHNGSYVCFEEIGHSSDFYEDGQKFQVNNVKLEDGTFTVNRNIQPNMKKTVRWCLAKDDVTPQDIFRLTNEGPKERGIIAKYCIQDCNLVHHLMNKIDVMTGFVEMAKICSVPINFLIMRGQGIKLLSFIAKKCRDKDTLLPVIEKKENDGGYEGAIVLDPKCNLYLDEPVACVDYSSLYPSSMISENLSHDSKVWTKEYDLDGKLIKTVGETDSEGNFIYDNLPEYKYVDVKYDTYKYVRKTAKSAAVKVLDGTKVCRFAQFPEGKAIMPSILEELLAARKATRKKIKTEKDDFMKNILDKRQLGYKVTANSLYGQCGARTSSFYEKDVAASTTATGRKLLIYAKHIIEEVYGDRIVDTSQGKVHSHAEYIYGDTDSVFMSFKLTELDGTPITGRKALILTIELAKEAGELATKFLKKPHDLEYEKTFMPFCLLSKKRYVGMLYEEDPDKCKRKSMGIVLKRRDNAPIVKDIYGGVIDILMKDQNIEKAIDFTKQCLDNIVKEKYPIEKLIITKSLRGYYKVPEQIAHKVLADRMGKRDPGNKPGPGDRIPFVYIQTKSKKALQGDKVEHPDFVKENKLKLDYSFYISNQIMKPLLQLFGLVLEDIPEYKKRVASFQSKIRRLRAEFKDDIVKFQKKETDIRDKAVKSLIFEEYLRYTDNLKKGNKPITNFFKAK